MIAATARMTAAVLGGLGVTLACSALGPAPSTAAPSTAAPAAAAAPPRDLVYVASADSGPVTAYAAGSTGAVSPARTIASPHKAGTEWDPWGVAFDASGHLYVQSFLSDATTFVFPPRASGATAPTRMFVASSPDNQSIAVDAKGFEYVAGGEAGAAIAVVRPGAKGDPRRLYAVSALRRIPLDESFNPWPSILSTDARNEVLAAVARPRGNAIEIFTGGARGGGRPVRVVTGRNTGLGSCASFSATGCREVSITVSPATGLIYAAVSSGATTHISVFAAGARGNARPIRTIGGPATGLRGKVITGIAVSRLDGAIYVMVKSSQFGAGRVVVFGRDASGDIRPLRSFTDRRSGFVNAAGLAILIRSP
jgi:hypothetical protein